MIHYKIVYMQIHCEETGLFLELVDIIRGCGWAILKGVMEVREDKIWACFIVEDMVTIGLLDKKRKNKKRTTDFMFLFVFAYEPLY